VLGGDFIVGADGATSFVRRSLATPFTRADLHVTLGYFIPSAPSNEMKIYFLPGLEGYIWSFPRPDHVSYGLISRPEPGWAQRFKALLRHYALVDLGADAMRQAEFYSAPVPCLRPGSWRTNVFAGEGWALLGDAAGLVDAITGEGIYYALRSAELLGAHFPDVASYTEAIGLECVSELERAARMHEHFYRGRFCGGAFTLRMVQLARRSASVRHVVGELVAGSLPYVGLKRRLAGLLPRVAVELALSPFGSD
jgi:flavin-dependent dehydrogenase